MAERRAAPRLVMAPAAAAQDRVLEAQLAPVAARAQALAPGVLVQALEPLLVPAAVRAQAPVAVLVADQVPAAAPVLAVALDRARVAVLVAALARVPAQARAVAPVAARAQALAPGVLVQALEPLLVPAVVRAQAPVAVLVADQVPAAAPVLAVALDQARVAALARVPARGPAVAPAQARAVVPVVARAQDPVGPGQVAVLALAGAAARAVFRTAASPAMAASTAVTILANHRSPGRATAVRTLATAASLSEISPRTGRIISKVNPPPFFSSVARLNGLNCPPRVGSLTVAIASCALSMVLLETVTPAEAKPEEQPHVPGETGRPRREDRSYAIFSRE